MLRTKWLELYSDGFMSPMLGFGLTFKWTKRRGIGVWNEPGASVIYIGLWKVLYVSRTLLDKEIALQKYQKNKE